FSYGPGRYDPNYEDKGQDYPLPFVRWTEQRNFEAILDMMAAGALDVSALISHRIPFVEAPKAYELLTSDKAALGILLGYDHAVEPRHIRAVTLNTLPAPVAAGAPVVGFIGAGNYASRMLIPAFKAAGARLQNITSSGGTSAV